MALNNTAKRCVDAAVTAFRRKITLEQRQKYLESLVDTVKRMEQKELSMSAQERAGSFADSFLYHIIIALLGRSIMEEMMMNSGSRDVWDQWRQIFQGYLPICDLSLYLGEWFDEAFKLLNRLGYECTKVSGTITDAGVGSRNITYLCIPDPELPAQ